MTGPVLSRSDVPGQPPRCGTCRQPMPWIAPRCTCGHHLDSHHITRGGNSTHCSAADAAGPCDCGRYEHAEDGHYGPLPDALSTTTPGETPA